MLAISSAAARVRVSTRRFSSTGRSSQDASAGNPASELAGLFLVTATAKPGQNLGEIQRVIDDEIAKLKTTPVTAEELERAYVELESRIHPRPADRVWGRPNSSIGMRRSSTIPAYLGKDLARYRSVTAADVQQAAREYLTDKRVVLSVVPRRTPPAGTTAARSRRHPLRPVGSAPECARPRHPRPSPRKGPRRRSGPRRWICRCCRRGAPIRS